MTTPDNAMIDPMPELDIDTAGHTGIRIRGYSVERVKALLDRIASLEAELISQTNRAAAAEQQVSALTLRLDTANALNTDAREQLAQVQAAPDGWKLVPIRPTDEMIAAAHESDREYSQRAFGGAMHMPQGGEDHWSTMLAASQTPPQREPLTDAQIRKLSYAFLGDNGPQDTRVIKFTRAIEATHGIQGEVK